MSVGAAQLSMFVPSGVALIAAIAALTAVLFVLLVLMYTREKAGKPIFLTISSPPTYKSSTAAATVAQPTTKDSV